MSDIDIYYGTDLEENYLQTIYRAIAKNKTKELNIKIKVRF